MTDSEDLAFYTDYRALTEENKTTVRDMARCMRERARQEDTQRILACVRTIRRDPKKMADLRAICDFFEAVLKGMPIEPERPPEK